MYYVGAIPCGCPLTNKNSNNALPLQPFPKSRVAEKQRYPETCLPFGASPSRSGRLERGII
jgi:hypothetical protein